MMNKIRKHLAELLDEDLPDGGTVAELLAEVLLDSALAGDMAACRIVIELTDSYDEIEASAWEDRR